MRKKNLKVQVAALAVTGVIAATPLSVRAQELGNPAATNTEAGSSTAAPDTGTVTPAATGVASTSTASTTTPAAGTGASDPATTAPAAGTGASNPAAPAAPASMAATTAPATSSGASTTTSGTAGSTESTAGTTTATTAAVSSDVITNSDGSISFRESAVDSGTTAPNNVKDEVTDDKQETDIHFSGEFKNSWISIPAGNSINATIKPEDAKEGKTLAELPGGFNSVSAFSDIKAEDMIMKGDLSIAKDGASSYDSTEMDAHSVDKEESYSLKADLNVSSVSKALTASEGVGKNIIPSWVSELLRYKTRDLSINDAYVNNLTTGFRTVVQMDNNLDGSFYLPKDLADAKKHYELSSADGHPMIYRINYRNSSFSEKKVSIAMDLDLTKMTPLENQYTGHKVGLEHLYGAGNKIENFRHPSNEHKYNTSVFGNLRKLVNSSAQTIQLVMKGIKLNSAADNRVETETSSTTEKENITEKTITTEGSFKGTLVGYMNADVGHDKFNGKVSYTWGAIQNDAGRDQVAGHGNDKVYLTVKFTDKERTVTQITPVNPVQPENPTNPVTPNNGENGGNGGNGGGVSDRTPVIPSTTPSVTPVSNPGEVLGENRPAPTPEENTVTAPEKKGEVLGESRPNPSGKTLSTRAKVSTGDYNYTALWASLFGMSLVALAGFVVLSKKEEN